jgi:hypothetical protein
VKNAASGNWKNANVPTFHLLPCFRTLCQPQQIIACNLSPPWTDPIWQQQITWREKGEDSIEQLWW